MLVEPLPHDALDEVVTDQQARCHRPPDLGADLRVVLHIPPEDVPDSDMHEVEVLGEHLGVSSLTAALDAHDDIFPHRSTFAWNGPAGSPRRWGCRGRFEPGSGLWTARHRVIGLCLSGGFANCPGTLPGRPAALLACCALLACHALPGDLGEPSPVSRRRLRLM